MFFRRSAVIAIFATGLLTACEREEQVVAPQPRVIELEEPTVVIPEERREVTPEEQARIETEGEDTPAIEAQEPEETRELMEEKGVEVATPSTATQGQGFLTFTAPDEFDNVTDRLEEAVEERDGIKIVKVFEIQERAEDVDVEMGKSEVFAIGSPELLADVTKQHPAFAINVPIRVLVYEQAGRTHIVHPDMKVLAQQHGVDPMTPSLKAMTDVVEAVVASAAGQQRAQLPADDTEAVLGEGEARDY